MTKNQEKIAESVSVLSIFSAEMQEVNQNNLDLQKQVDDLTDENEKLIQQIRNMGQLYSELKKKYDNMLKADLHPTNEFNKTPTLIQRLICN